MPKEPLLLDRCWFGVALGDDQPPQGRTMFAWNLLPHRLPVVVAESDAAIGLFLRQENSPTIIRHLNVIKSGPALGIDADRGAQIHARCVEIAGAESVPPVQKLRLPVL